MAHLRPLEKRLRQQGVSALYLFGSTARDEADDNSDLDLVFEYEPNSGFSVFDQSYLEDELAKELRLKVDLISRKGLRPPFRARVESELVQVF